MSRKTIRRFLLQTYSFGGLIEPAAWTTIHTLGGGTSLEKSTSKNTSRKKIFPLLSLKKNSFKTLTLHGQVPYKHYFSQ